MEDKKKKIEQEQQLEEVNGGHRLPPDEEFWVKNNPLNYTK